MIHIRLCALDTIHHAAFNKLESTLPNEFIVHSQVHLQVRSQVHAWICSQGRSQLDSMTLPACLTICSEVSCQDALKYTPGHALKDTLNRTRWHTPSLPDLRSQVSSQGHSQLHSMAHSQLAWLHDPHSTRWHTPSLLNYMLPSKLSRRSEAHSRACSQGRPQLHSMEHS